MASVSKLMQLQVDIDKIIEGKKKGDEPSKEQIDQLIQKIHDAEARL